MKNSGTVDTLKLNLIQDILESNSSAKLQQISDLFQRGSVDSNVAMMAESEPISIPDSMDGLSNEGISMLEPLSFGEYMNFDSLPQSGKFGHDFP